MVFLGPDGVGKSTVLEAAKEDLRGAFYDVTYRTYAPMLLRRATLDGKGPPPHSLRPRSKAAAFAKAIYWAGYYSLGYFPTAYRDRARAALAINHRYLVDAIVDPRRYRYSGPVSLISAIWKFVPKPDLVILLDAPADVIQARKKEVEHAECSRQVTAYRKLVGAMENGRIIDAARPVDDVIADVDRTILDALFERTSRRLGTIS